MTTRAERLANAERLAREQLERQRDRLAKVQAAQRAEERKDVHKRRLVVGQLVESAGLFVLDDTTLGALFTLLAPFVHMPNPVPVLESLLADTERLAAVSVPGCAHRGGGVTAVQ